MQKFSQNWPPCAEFGVLCRIEENLPNGVENAKILLIFVNPLGHSTSNQHSHPTRPSPILLKITYSYRQGDIKTKISDLGVNCCPKYGSQNFEKKRENDADRRQLNCNISGSVAPREMIFTPN